MIIIRTPLRISIAGGGTDLPVWYKEHGSMFISAAINKYIYITLQKSSYNKKINLRYSEIEEVENVENIKHDIIRETLRYCQQKEPLQITSHADIPSGTGLGSSGSFGVSVLHALNPEKTKPWLAAISSYIQIDILNHPIGLQDQFIASYGGIRLFTINQQGNINVKDINAAALENYLVMFYTRYKHSTTQFLASSSLEGLKEVQNIAWEAKEALEETNLDKYGLLLDKHWQAKKKRHPEMSNPEIDKWYNLALENGALGGKLIGAGGGGFLLFYTNDREKLIKAMPIQYQPFKFDFEGSKVIYDD